MEFCVRRNGDLERGFIKFWGLTKTKKTKKTMKNRIRSFLQNYQKTHSFYYI